MLGVQRPKVALSNKYKDTLKAACKQGGYVMRKKILIPQGTRIEGAVRMTIARINELYPEITRQLDSQNMTIDKIYIGKTYCDKKGDTAWNYNGPAQRFRAHQKNFRAHTLLAISVVQNDFAPIEADFYGPGKNPAEEFALAIEKSVALHWAKPENRPGPAELANKPYKPGKKCKKQHDVFCIYFAFSV